MKVLLYIFIFLTIPLVSFAQKDTIPSKKEKKIKLKKKVAYNALSPSKAAFYSMIFPGGGQIYNKRVSWQLPLIYGGLGYSIYSYATQNRQYHRVRDAYKLRQAGLIDEFTRDGLEDVFTDSYLESAQEQTNYNRNLSLLSIIAVYVLQIVEASVRAHLLQFDTSKDLSLTPSVSDFNYEEAPQLGLTLKYKF